jgi:putative transcriptional regulator
MTEIIIRNQIRRLRFENGEMTQQELARRSGCTRQTIHAIEAAKYGPSLELAFKIAEVFGVGIEAVFQCEVATKVKTESGRRFS